MQNSAVDNLIILKDAPMYWRRPSFVKTEQHFGQVNTQIYFSIMFGQETPPTRKEPLIVRGSIKRTEATETYFVCLFQLNKIVTNYSYPPVGTNTLDPVSMMPAILKDMHTIDKAAYDLQLVEYKPFVPQRLVDSLLAIGGRW